MDEPTYLGLTEAEVRALRNRVYEQKCSDQIWYHIRQLWLQPGEVAFLKAHDFALNPTKSV
jgi:hypothetical protein